MENEQASAPPSNGDPSPIGGDTAGAGWNPRPEPGDGSGVPSPPGPPPAGYVWAYRSPKPPEPSWKPSRWLIVATAIWAVALLVAGVIYARDGKPTVRGQTTIVGAIPTVDAAIRNVVTAAGTGPVVEVGSLIKEGSCKITAVRTGVAYQRTVTIFTAPDAESGELSTIAHGLPRSYAATAGPGAILALSADAGNYVGLSGAVPAPGEIRVRASTGCREQGGSVPAMSPPLTDPPRVHDVLTLLGVQAASRSQTRINCPGGTGAIRTVTVHVPPGHVPGPLDTALTTLSAGPVAASPNVFAYHAGGADVVASQDPSGLTVSETTRC